MVICILIEAFAFYLSNQGTHVTLRQKSHLAGHMYLYVFEIYFLVTNIGTNITTNFRVGMGLFVDKPIAPYVDETDDR